MTPADVSLDDARLALRMFYPEALSDMTDAELDRTFHVAIGLMQEILAWDRAHHIVFSSVIRNKT